MRFVLSFTCLTLVVDMAVAAPKTDEAKEMERLEKAGARVTVDDSLSGPARLAVTFEKLDDKTAAGLKGLKRVGKLTVEDASKLTDKSMGILGSFTGLRELSLINSGMTNAGMAPLKNLKDLRKLYLLDAKVADSGVASLKALDKLEELDLSGSGITNAAGSTFKELPNLTLLAVSKTKFGDTGAAYLKELKSLRQLEAVNTDLSVKGAVALEEAIKGVRVRR